MSENIITTVADIAVFTKITDGGPVICENCVTAWRPDFQRCPACGHSLSGAEQNTPRAHQIYKEQRKDDAPKPGLNANGK
jgi:ribosomal protein L34E